MTTVKRVRKPAAPKKPSAPKKAPVAKKTNGSAPVGGVTPILPGEDGWDTTLKGRRGKPDVVSPTMDPLVESFVAAGTGGFQLVPGDPFTINQVRNWAFKRNGSGDLDGIRIRISGGVDGKNIGVDVVSANVEGE